MSKYTAVTAWRIKIRKDHNRVLAVLSRAGVVDSYQRQLYLYKKCVLKANPRDLCRED